jgi:O-antigen/teichoic acid export membrane protein
MNLTSIKEFKSTFQGLLVADSFKRNLAITLSGQALGQVVGFLFTPFIARAYGPENYGVFSLFIAIATNLSSISTLQFPTGYVSARNPRELHSLLQITLLSLVSFTLTFTIAVFLFKDSLLSLLDAGSLTFLIYLVPLYAFFMGFDYMMLGWNIYLKQFSRGAIAKISSIILSKGTTLLYGLFVASSPIGLITGNFLIYPLESSVKLSKQVRTEFSKIISLPNWKELKEVFLRYKSYPLFVTPGLLVSSINGQLPVYFFSIYFHNSFVGLFALASSIVTMPISVITNSTTTVFLQKAAETHRTNPGMLKDHVLSLHNKLFLLCVLPLTFFAFVSDWAFVLVFGIEWEQAGWIAAFLAISTILSVPQQPLSVLFRLLGKEHQNLMLNIVSILLRAAGLCVGVYYNDIKIAIAGFALGSILTMACSLALIFSMVNIKLIKLGWYVVVVLAIFTLITFQKFYS